MERLNRLKELIELNELRGFIKNVFMFMFVFFHPLGGGDTGFVPGHGV